LLKLAFSLDCIYIAYPLHPKTTPDVGSAAERKYRNFCKLCFASIPGCPEPEKDPGDGGDDGSKQQAILLLTFAE
jgi:hypothetical protein